MQSATDNRITAALDREPTRIGVVCPCYEEEQGIETFYTHLKRVLLELGDQCRHEIIFVDDGSRDATLECLRQIARRDRTVSVYSLTRNRGHQVALSAGLDVADADAVVVMDADLQHPPELIPELIRQWQQGHDVVLAVRRQTQGASLFKRLSSNAFYWLFNLLSDVKLTPGAADFCLLSRRAHQSLRGMHERRRFLRGMIAWMGYPTARVQYIAPPRCAGQSKYRIGRMLGLALDATFSFSTRPIRMASKAGVVCVAAGLAYLGYVLGRYILIGDLLPGWASIVGTIIVMGGFQLLSIGLIGEYLAHVLEEVKGRPGYLFKETPETAGSCEPPSSVVGTGNPAVIHFRIPGGPRCV